jgi:hypothetical protein
VARFRTEQRLQQHCRVATWYFCARLGRRTRRSTRLRGTLRTTTSCRAVRR